jgi:hypothetical protein
MITLLSIPVLHLIGTVLMKIYAMVHVLGIV